MCNIFRISTFHHAMFILSHRFINQPMQNKKRVAVEGMQTVYLHNAKLLDFHDELDTSLRRDDFFIDITQIGTLQNWMRMSFYENDADNLEMTIKIFICNCEDSALVFKERSAKMVACFRQRHVCGNMFDYMVISLFWRGMQNTASADSSRDEKLLRQHDKNQENTNATLKK